MPKVTFRRTEKVAPVGETYEKGKTYLLRPDSIEHWKRRGAVDDAPDDAEVSQPLAHKENPEDRRGPTIEEWCGRGYDPAAYPPKGFAEVPSRGLTAYRAEQAESKRRAAESPGRTALTSHEPEQAQEPAPGEAQEGESRGTKFKRRGAGKEAPPAEGDPQA